MEFLICRGFREVSSATSACLAQATSFRGPEVPYSFANDDFYIFSNVEPLSDFGAGYDSKHKLALFDGHAFHANKFLHPFTHPDERTITALMNAMSTRQADSATGVFVVGGVNLAEKSFQLYCDPLSQYPLAIWQQGSRYIVSNNELLIESFLQFRGYSVERDAECMLLNSIAVMNLSCTSPFNDVSYLPPRHALRGNRVLEQVELFSDHYLCTPPSSYEDLIEVAAKNLTQRCETLLTDLGGHYFLTDLTGGMDTRTVFAALLATGRLDEIRAWCNTKYPHPDANVADHIMSEYQLRHGALMLNWVNELPDHEQKMRRGLFRNRGARYTGWTDLGAGYFTRLVRLGGSFGEIGRSNVYSEIFENTNIRIDDIGSEIHKRSSRIGNYDLITEAGQQIAHRQIQSHVTDMVKSDIPRANIPDLLYLHGRGRYHFGHQSACGSGLKIAPFLLYDLNLVWANMCLAPAERIAGKAQFDLIRKFGGDKLAKIPFADKRWSAEIVPVALRAEYEKVEVITRNSRRLPFDKEAMEWLFCWPTDKVTLEPPPSPPEWARGRDHNWRQLTTHQKIATDLLARTDGSEVYFETVDRKELVKLAKMKPEDIQHHWTVSSLGRVVGGLMWYLKMEDRTQISEKYEGEYP